MAQGQAAPYGFAYPPLVSDLALFPRRHFHELMKLTAVTLCYVGFLRFSDLMVIQWQEVRFLPTHMELFLEKS
jgi:hypothetical protein